jgi:hypothetical protein
MLAALLIAGSSSAASNRFRHYPGMLCQTLQADSPSITNAAGKMFMGQGTGKTMSFVCPLDSAMGVNSVDEWNPVATNEAAIYVLNGSPNACRVNLYPVSVRFGYNTPILGSVEDVTIAGYSSAVVTVDWTHMGNLYSDAAFLLQFNGVGACDQITVAGIRMYRWI